MCNIKLNDWVVLFKNYPFQNFFKYKKVDMIFHTLADQEQLTSCCIAYIPIQLTNFPLCPNPVDSKTKFKNPSVP